MNPKQKEKEQAEKMKALRRELEEKLEEQLVQESPLSEMMGDKTHVDVQRLNENEALEPGRSKQVIEALLFASSKPITVQEIRRVLRFLTAKEIDNFIQELKSEFEAQNRSYELLEIAGGYEIATKKEFAPWIFKIELQKKAKQVTQSALETLSILAYKQPITRAEIEDLRGVDVSGVMSTLTERGLIKIVGKKEVPGRPFLYGTTDKFLEHFGLKSLQDLPNIDEIKNLVDNSVKKETLLGTTNVVDVPAEETQPAEAASSEEPEAIDASSEEQSAVEEDSAETNERKVMNESESAS